MKDILAEDFQDLVHELLTRHKSILDLITKYQDSNARVNRSIIKAVTNCGCIQIEGKKQVIPTEATLEEMRNYMDTQLRGSLCENCKEIIKRNWEPTFFT